MTAIPTFPRSTAWKRAQDSHPQEGIDQRSQLPGKLLTPASVKVFLTYNPAGGKKRAIGKVQVYHDDTQPPPASLTR